MSHTTSEPSHIWDEFLCKEHQVSWICGILQHITIYCTVLWVSSSGYQIYLCHLNIILSKGTSVNLELMLSTWQILSWHSVRPEGLKALLHVPSPFPVADLRAGAPACVQIFLNFMRFFRKIWQNHMLVCPRGLAAPPTGRFLCPLLFPSKFMIVSMLMDHFTDR